MWVTILSCFAVAAGAMASFQLIDWLYSGDDWMHYAARYGSFAVAAVIGGVIVGSL